MTRLARDSTSLVFFPCCFTMRPCRATISEKSLFIFLIAAALGLLGVPMLLSRPSRCGSRWRHGFILSMRFWLSKHGSSLRSILDLPEACRVFPVFLAVESPLCGLARVAMERESPEVDRHPPCCLHQLEGLIRLRRGRSCTPTGGDWGEDGL